MVMTQARRWAGERSPPDSGDSEDQAGAAVSSITSGSRTANRDHVSPASSLTNKDMTDYQTVVLHRDQVQVRQGDAELCGDAFCAGEIRGQELSGSVQCNGRLVKHLGIGLEDVGHPRGDIERDLDVGGGRLSREANGVVEENLVTSALDDQGRQAGQVGENGTDQAKCGV